MAYRFPRCEVVPQPGFQASFQIEGKERLRWHYGAEYDRPFFYPLTGPSGSPLTRMGHPGTFDHDHHLSVWFAHHDLDGHSFWSYNGKGRMRQKHWLRYRDGDSEALMATLVGWYDPEGTELVEQELVAALIPGPEGEVFVEFQSTFRPMKDTVTFGKTNFGFLAVRVAKSLSSHFGGGHLTNSEGMKGEPAIFEQSAHWVDYSGPVPLVKPDGTRVPVTEGITYFDHPGNPGYPAHWHVREDGWMGAGATMMEPITLTKGGDPLVLRYLLHAHAGEVDPATADAILWDFSTRPGFTVGKATIKHHKWDAHRTGQEEETAAIPPQ